MKNKIKLQFEKFELEAELFETEVAKKLYQNLPVEIELTHWGNEMYGPIGVNLGTESPVPDIPAGGLAYTNRGNYFCIFFGQTPAWPVEHVGRMIKDDWKGRFGTGLKKVRIDKV